MSTVTDFVDEQFIALVDNNLLIHDQEKLKDVEEKEGGCQVVSSSYGVCAICLDKIVLQETALIKGCEHAYCVTCILRWASYSEHPKCPQCKNQFESLNVHRALDGSIHDYMFEESVCLLLRATWFEPLAVDQRHNVYDELDNFYPYEDEYDYVDEDEDDLDEVYFNNSSTLRIGNRRWGDNGYIRSGRQEARPVHGSNFQDSWAGSSRERRKKEVARDCDDPCSSREPKKKECAMGRRAKRALKREAANKAASSKA